MVPVGPLYRHPGGPVLAGGLSLPGWALTNSLSARCKATAPPAPFLVDLEGFEPPTRCLQSSRSPPELQAQNTALRRNTCRRPGREGIPLPPGNGTSWQPYVIATADMAPLQVTMPSQAATYLGRCTWQRQ